MCWVAVGTGVWHVHLLKRFTIHSCSYQLAAHAPCAPQHHHRAHGQVRHEFLVADTDQDGFLSEVEVAQMILADDEGKEGLAHHERNSKSFKQRALLHARSCMRRACAATCCCVRMGRHRQPPRAGGRALLHHARPARPTPAASLASSAPNWG